jgi:lipopolysaccharide biosynthesis protein
LIRQLQLSDDQIAELYPAIDNQWECSDPHSTTDRASPTNPSDIAVYIHLFYTDCWPDFCFALKNVTCPFDLHISMPESKEDIEAQIRAAYPYARFHYIENRGRDIWPFLRLLQSGTFQAYRAVCKLHSKKSPHLIRSDSFDIGRRWRRSAIFELMGTPERVDRIVDCFRSNPSVGVVGPTNLRICQPSGATSESGSDWGMSKNWATMSRLFTRLGIAETALPMDFFAGSMFWFSPSAFRALVSANFSAQEFEPEPISAEGALPHAMERLFNVVSEQAGFAVLGSRNLSGDPRLSLKAHP